MTDRRLKRAEKHREYSHLRAAPAAYTSTGHAHRFTGWNPHPAPLLPRHRIQPDDDKTSGGSFPEDEPPPSDCRVPDWSPEEATRRATWDRFEAERGAGYAAVRMQGRYDEREFLPPVTMRWA